MPQSTPGERDEWRALVDADTLHMLPIEAHIASVRHLAARLLELTDGGDLLDRIEAKLGPLVDSQVLVLRDVVGVEGDDLLTELLECASSRWPSGPAAAHVPLIICLTGDASLELLDVDMMRAAGWYRSPGLPVTP